jgi:hypothetical protein
MTTYQLHVNGERKDINVDPPTPLLWVLREDLKMTGTKYGCGIGACGACTTLIWDSRLLVIHRECAEDLIVFRDERVGPCGAQSMTQSDGSIFFGDDGRPQWISGDIRVDDRFF